MDLSSILENLTEDDMKKLRETAASFFGAADGAEKTSSPAKTDNALSFPGISPQLLGQAAQLSAALNKKDPRSDFLLALKPLLSPARQKKADEAAMMVRLFAVLGTIKEGGI
jgi:hypothetical protein